MKNLGIFVPPEGEAESHAYHTPIEKKVRAALSPFHSYIKSQAAASIFLFLCTLGAILWASLPAISSTYNSFVSLPIGFHVSSLLFEKSLRFWVNDVLLALFFFFVGLEIKREFLVGELTNRKTALLVFCAAMGGMVVPATIFYFINFNAPTAFAWGIPMATDTAFALGILSCFRKKIPGGVFTFLAALAIIDDIGAILVIALFYSNDLNTYALFLTLILSGVLLTMNFMGLRRPLPYIIVGMLIWSSIEIAGIHGTVSGILIAFLVPARPQKGPNYFIKKTKDLLYRFEKRKEENPLILEDQKQHRFLEEVQETAQAATTPLQSWESKLELPIALVVLPLFALVNAGIPINLKLIDDIFIHPISLGIVFGLIVGKPLGVIAFSQFAIKSKLGIFPKNTDIKHISAVSLLTGIGFTMSIFISNLSFLGDSQTLTLCKAAVLLGSLIAALFGIIAIGCLSKETHN